MKSLKYQRIALLTIAIVLIGIGIYVDEIKIVLTKAIYICYECIGIG